MNVFFPMMWWIPAFDADVVEGAGIKVVKRKWEVSIFDLYSLVAQKHPVELPAEILNVFLSKVNLEVEIEEADRSSAAEVLNRFRAMLYLYGICPTGVPYGANVSLNRIAGINDRSAGFQAKMHEGLREGITHEDTRVAIWPHELTFGIIRGSEISYDLTSALIEQAASDAQKWKHLETKHGALRAARRALVQAPLLPDLGSSILQIWQGIEGLFPSVRTEITYRTSLMLAQLCIAECERSSTYAEAKKSYADRSKVVHGTQESMTIENWNVAWGLLRKALIATLKRGTLPTEDELTNELLKADGNL